METETLWPLHIHLFLFMFFADVSAFHFKEIQWNLHITLNSKPRRVEANLSSGMFNLIRGLHSGVNDALRPSSLFSTSKLKHWYLNGEINISSFLSFSPQPLYSLSCFYFSVPTAVVGAHSCNTPHSVMLCSYSPAWETWPIAKCGGSSAHVQTQTHTGTHIGFWVRC